MYHGFHGSMKPDWPTVLVYTVSYALQIINVLLGIAEEFQKSLPKPLFFGGLTN
jgi:hypothetical protein